MKVFCKKTRKYKNRKSDQIECTIDKGFPNPGNRAKTNK